MKGLSIGCSARVSAALLIIGAIIFLVSLLANQPIAKGSFVLVVLRFAFLIIVIAPAFLIDSLACLIAPRLFHDQEWIELFVPGFSSLIVVSWGYLVGLGLGSWLAFERPDQVISPIGGAILGTVVVVIVYIWRDLQRRNFPLSLD